MLVDESVQTSRNMERRAFEEKVMKEGMELWNRQQEFQKMKKTREQNEMKELLEHHWNWGEGLDAKPRGLRNLRLEELFPNDDYKNAKRFVGTYDLGRGGGGAPVFSCGKPITRTREDPILRFQFGNKDLRRCVDNTLRYKTNKDEQLKYKNELDDLVREKKQKQEKEKTDSLKFYREQGWSNEKTMKDLANGVMKSKLEDAKSGITMWDKQRQVYLTELAEQMERKKQQIKEMQLKELESIRKHFSTWNGLWGRPGHGAPILQTGKHCLKRLLYPQMAPIGVH